jgi:hypothetical protein
MNLVHGMSDMKWVVLGAAALISACSSDEQVDAAALPDWVEKLVAAQPLRSATVVEEATYLGRRVFEVLPSDRADDSGNEHILYSEDGRIICEFGGFVGHVTVGSCDIEKIKFVRTLFPSRPG